MLPETDIVRQVRQKAAEKVLFLSHALRQMVRPERMISHLEVRRVLERGELVEDYPEDARGHSCLLLGFGDGGRPVHVVCAPKEDFVAVITAYLPDASEWQHDFKTRRKP